MEIKVTKENACIGLRVVRGKDWNWGSQDNHSSGTIIENVNYYPINTKSDWCTVKWDEGKIGSQSYRIGFNNYFDLYVDESTIKFSSSSNTTIYHAETIEEAKILLNEAHKQGYYWCGGDSFIEKLNWNKYEEKTFYHILKGTYGSLSSKSSKKYKVVKVKDLFNLNNKTNEVSKTDSKQGATRREGLRANRKTVKAVSGCRPIGSRITNRRKKARARTVKISGRRLQLD